MSSLLYKYVDIGTGINHILNGGTLKFSKPPSFNDPFELSEHFNTEVEQTSDAIAHFGYLENFFGILCLTKNPLNILMWSHYASGDWDRQDSLINNLMTNEHGHSVSNRFHSGLVFGIDPVLAELSTYHNNSIPSAFGNVIYSTKKPDQKYSYSDMHERRGGYSPNFELRDYPHLRGTFLNKPMCWSYEEEVRVVRNTKFNERKIDVEPGYITGNEIYDFPKESIKEIYIGVRNSNSDIFIENIGKLIEQNAPNCSLYRCIKDVKNWEFKSSKV